MKALVAIEFSEAAERMITVLEGMSGRDDVEVFLLHVAPPEPDFVGYGEGPNVVRDQVVGDSLRERYELHALAERLRAGGLATTVIMVQGRTVQAIIEQAEECQATLIVIGSHGRGAVFDLLVGSVSAGVVRRASVPVLVVPAHG